MVQVMGIQHLRDGLEPVSVIGADMAVIGIVGTAPGANAAVFPFNRPVRFSTNDLDMLKALGTLGTLPDAVAAISAQLATAAAQVVVVRIDPGANLAAAMTAILGNEGLGTGMWALLASAEETGITPRIVIIPGYTSQTENGVAAITVSNGGTGYLADFPVTGTGGSGSGFAGIARVQNGAIVEVDIVNPGKEYATAPTLVFTAGGGTGAAGTATLGAVGNQIMATVPTILSRLKAKFIPEGPTSSRATALSWLQSLPRSMNIVHPLRQDAKVSVNGSTVTKPLSPYIAGLYARRDAEFGGIPSHSVANQSVNALVGVTPSIPLDITSDASIGMTDISDHFGIVVKGDLGSDGSLSDGGFTFWGTDTLDDSGQWLFANVVRLRDYVEIQQIKAIRTYLGKQNISIQTVQAIHNTLDDQLANLRRNGHIIDYRISFDPDDNPAGDLRLGWLKITFQMEEPAPLRRVTIRSRRYSAALDALVANIAVQLGTLQSA